MGEFSVECRLKVLKMENIFMRKACRNGEFAYVLVLGMAKNRENKVCVLQVVHRKVRVLSKTWSFDADVNIS
jgi:hypothetical protein